MTSFGHHLRLKFLLLNIFYFILFQLFIAKSQCFALSIANALSTESKPTLEPIEKSKLIIQKKTKTSTQPSSFQEKLEVIQDSTIPEISEAITPNKKGPFTYSSKTIETLFQSLNSDNLKIYSKEDTLALKSKLFPLKTMGLTWQPDLEVLSQIDECHSSIFKRHLVNTSQRELEIQKFWSQCEHKWRLNTYNPLTQIQEILRTDFEPSQHPEVRMIQWTFKDRTHIRGFLFFKGPQKKPLVLLRPGIFSHLRSSVAERFLMMMLFDEGPFHLLLIPSNTGADYIEDNSQIHFGDDSEFIQTSEILDQIQDPKEPLNQYIKSIHLVGISLGSYGLLKANARERKKEHSLLDRSIFLCPAVDLKSSLNTIESSWINRVLLRIWFDLRLSQLKTPLGLTSRDSIFDFIKTKMEKETSSLLSLLSDYNYNHSFVIWTKLDPVLNPDTNAKMLQLHSLLGSSFLELPRGIHCSLSTAYQWPIVSLMLRGYLDPKSLLHQKDWSASSQKMDPIKNILIHDILLDQHGALKLSLLIHFINPLKTPQIYNIRISQNFTEHSWALQDFNDTYKKTLIREFSSRLEWEQSDNTLGLRLY